MDEVKQDVTEPIEQKKEELPEKESKEIRDLKAALSRANSEAADYKRQLRAKQTEEERKAAERAEQEKQREERIAELEAFRRYAVYKDKLLDAGVDAASADVMARSLPEGVSDAYFDTMKQLYEKQKQAAVAAALSKQPQPSVGAPPKSTSKEDEIAEKAWKAAGLN